MHIDLHLFNKASLLRKHRDFQPKSVLKSRKSDFDGILEDEEPLYDCAEETSHPSNLELVIDSPNVSPFLH